MTVLEQIGLFGLVPVVVIDDIADAMPTAAAMVDGGLPIMEITLRTEQGISAIETIAQYHPEILVGAGTVMNVEQAKQAVGSGARFVVSPGLNDEVVRWCVKNDVPITPGCVTPTEIDRALQLGITIVKFFPANIYGGIEGCKALHGPYRMVKFIPTGGISLSNLPDYACQPFIHAVGGGWLCSTQDMQNKDYANITKTVKASIKSLLGFELAHIGINAADEAQALALANTLSDMFDLTIKDGNSSVFAGTGVEVIKGGLDGCGHIAIATNSIDRAVHYLARHGYRIDESSVKMKNGRKLAVYLDGQIGGFRLHLMQK
jgi:2-dehydro-3-deoxyphosphogluconate aldolase/(4S)-4-hydroxy-2-oxoglutarate aldolase